MGISNDIKVNVVLSGQNDTSIAPFGNNNVTVSLGQQNIVVNKSAGSSVTIDKAGQEISIGVAGFQGPAGQSIFAKGEDGTLQYNRLGYVSGADNFLFFPETKEVLLSGGVFHLKNSNFKISGCDILANRFIVKDINDTSKNLLRIDPVSKKITLAESASATDYYVGIALENPTERLHVKGNIRVEGNIYLSGDLVPLLSGISNLGSLNKPFKDIFLQGSTINFVDAEAKISVTKDGFDFLVKRVEGNNTTIESILSIVTGLDGGVLKNVVGFAQAISGNAALLTGMPYTGLKDNGIFIEKDIPINSEEILINYGENLTYSPKVICNLIPPAGINDFYFTSVESITASSCKAVFSSKISKVGYKMNCFISPNDI